MSRLSQFVKIGVAGMLLFAVPALGAPAPASAQVSIGIGLAVNVGPPVLPIYVQPAAPAPNLIWCPGYWAWGPAGYFWVPGTWVAAPYTGYLWTPGYWGYGGGYYAWHPGYWGTHVGFYGGVNYGAGYFGVGYVGGGWAGGVFRYNTAVTNVNATYVHNTYVNNTVVVNNYNTVNRVSYNGGPGGIAAQPTEAERSAMQEQHLPPTPEQKQHISTASHDRNMLSSVNHGQLSPERAAFTQPLSKENRPADYTPLRTEDRQAASEHVISQPHGTSAYGGQSLHPQSTYAQHPAQPAYSQHGSQPAYSQHPSQPASSQHPQSHPQGQPPQHAPPEHDSQK
jgi:hypothetical protein